MNKFCKYCGQLIKNTKGLVCNTCVSKVRRLETKTKAVRYKGGQCEKCGYNSHIAALEFHHVNDNKDFTIGKFMNRSWDFIKNELDKCILLCSNCHRIEHSKYTETASMVKETSRSAKSTE